MPIVYYPAIIERAGAGYSVFFPDLPGLASAGDTQQEVAQAAEKALDAHLELSIEHGDPLPEPSNLDAIAKDPDVNEVGRILVRGERPGRTVRINITLDESLVAAIDKVTRNRSGFIASAARQALRQA